MNSPIYEADEDSFFLLDILQKELEKMQIVDKGHVYSLLDMGAGTGYIGFEMAKKGHSVVLADCNPMAVSYMQKLIDADDLQIKLYQTDLFEDIPVQKFDCIVFNTPYLPSEDEFEDSALHGGKYGCETACRFIDQVTNYLAEDGFVLLLTSSLAHTNKIKKTAARSGLSCDLLAVKSLFFEELQVYRLKIATNQ